MLACLARHEGFRAFGACVPSAPLFRPEVPSCIWLPIQSYAPRAMHVFIQFIQVKKFGHYRVAPGVHVPSVLSALSTSRHGHNVRCAVYILCIACNIVAQDCVTNNKNAPAVTPEFRLQVKYCCCCRRTTQPQCPHSVGAVRLCAFAVRMGPLCIFVIFSATDVQ